MNSIEIFKNERFGEIRVAGTSDEPLFCLADVCRAIGISNVGNVKSRLDDDDVRLTDTTDSLGRAQQINFVTESGLYDVIIRSDSGVAKPFRKWITSEVLPSIRKTGSYSIMGKVPTTFAEALRLAAEQQEQIESQQKLIEVQTPKAEFYDDVVESKDSLPMDKTAKTLNMGIGRNKLFALLRDEKILMRNNTPYQQYVDSGWFRCVESKFSKPNGDICINVKTVVLQKGLDGIRKLLRKKGYKNNVD